MAANKRPKICTCGPHPVVDLNVAGDSKEYAGKAAQAVRDACRSHGCFYLRLHPSDFKSAGSNEDDDVKDNGAVGSLRKLAGDLSPMIENLFDDQVLKSAKLDPNGGLKEMEYTRVGMFEAQGMKRSATYRGRTAESGAAASPEPKQSWEARRHAPRQEIQPPYMSLAPSETDREMELRGNRLKALEEWTNALHRAAEIVVEVLGIKPNIVLSNGPCVCSQLSDAGSACSMDLLRVFRYDALPKESDVNSRPGSSSHTDWGTLTIVWQDSSGGLQTYCHECDKWSDVEASQVGIKSSTVELFVHVGDFLSLATGGEYPSPRHRVLCPLAGKSSAKNESRCSLVYFSYPPPGVSLFDAEKKLSFSEDDDESDKPVCYERHSLLHDQSATAEQNVDDSSSSRHVYEKIKYVAFDKVIQEKWGQVQRK